MDLDSSTPPAPSATAACRRPAQPRGGARSRRATALSAGLCWLGGIVAAAGADAQPGAPWPEPATLSGPGIVPGQLSFNLDQQRRPLVFLVGYDAATRLVTVRTVERGETITATLLPHAELYHHAERGSIADFGPYQTMRIRLHPDQDGRWRLATYLLDDFWHLSGHKQYERIDSLAADGSALTCVVIDPPPVAKAGAPPATVPPPTHETIHLDAQTRYWRGGKRVTDPALTVGMSIRCNTHGTASGGERFAEDVVLDDQSLEQCFMAPQRERQGQRLAHDGYPGYVQATASDDLTVLLFRDVAAPAEHAFAVGTAVRVLPLAWSGQGGAPVTATVSESRRTGLGWQVRLHGVFTTSDWPVNHTALVFAPAAPAAPKP